MIGTLKTLFDRVTEKRRDAQLAKAENVRELAIQLAAEQLGTVTTSTATQAERESQLARHVEIIDEAGIDEDTLRLNIARIVERHAWAKLAEAGPTLKAEAQRLADAAEVFDREATEAYKAAMAKSQALHEAVRAAEAKHFAALEANAKLIDSSEVSLAENELSERQQAINATIATLRSKLNDNAQPGTGLHAMIGTHPAAFVRDTRAAIEKAKAAKAANVAVDPSRLTKLWDNLKLGEAAVAECQKQLAAAERELADIAKQFQTIAEMKLQPENFAWIEAKPAAPTAKFSGPSARDLAGVR